MTTTIGSSQTSLTDFPFGDTTTHNFYYTRFVSPPIYQTSIAANTWAYNFAASEPGGQGARNNFPVSGTNQPIHVNCYVWRPSSSSKIGTILDGNTASTIDEQASGNAFSHHVTFSGSAVSSVQNEDVIILEIWFIITEAAGAILTNANGFYYDGGTVQTTDNQVVTDHAAFIETPEDINLTPAGTTFERSPAAENVTVSDASTTRVLTANRAPSTDSPSIGESLTRQTQAFRIPSSDSVTVADSSLTRVRTLPRIPSTDSTTVSDVSTTRMLSATRTPTTENITVTDSSITRMTQAFRSPSSDSVTTGENLSGGKLIERSPSADSITVSDASLTRLLSAERVPSADTITVIESSLTRMYSALRIPSIESVTTSDEATGVIVQAGQFNRSPATENVTVGENLTRALQLFRVPSADSITVGENLSGGKLVERVVTAADTVNVIEQSLTRLLSASRNVEEDTSNVIEASLTRLLQAMRSPTQDTVTVAELQSLVSHSRSLQDTIAVTEPLLERIVTSIRQLGPEFVDVSEQVFYQAFHKFVFDSVSVAEQLFIEREQLGGSVSYATPEEVRPLLGNLGAQRTEAQITLAIDSAFDEINRKTNRVPPNEWKETEADFSIIKKIARYKAALEMSIGIKDFQDRELMQKEIDEMFMILEEHDTGGVLSNDIVISSEDETYALNPQGLIWSTRYKNLRKASTSENDTTINPDT